MILRIYFIPLLLLLLPPKPAPCQSSQTYDTLHTESLRFRNIGPFRGGRSVAVSGVTGNPQTYYFGSTGGGVWKTNNAGLSWDNISDGFFTTGSVGAIEIAPSDPNVIYAGMGEHAVRGVMTSHGDGIYRSEDAGKSWTHLGLKKSRHIAEIVIHPSNPDLLWVAVQGALHGPSEERGVYKSTDGGKTWTRVLYVNEYTGASDLSVDPSNPRILYAGMWEHRRYPWMVESGGEGSGLYKSVDGGENWKKLEKGLPKKMGKVAVDVSKSRPQRIYANIEAEKGGVFRSDDGGESWTQTCSDRVTIARAWYYIEIFADPSDPETVYVLNAPMLRSVDGGKTFRRISNPHGDQHDLWINPENPSNLILGNDGGACITFDGGASWSSQQNQPTAQFYRVIADQRFPYHLYAGQQDNSTMAIASRTKGSGIGWKDWYPVAGGESAFLAFDPNDPQQVYGGSYQGNISMYDHRTQTNKDIMAYPVIGLGSQPSEMKYRFNWNAPIVAKPQDPTVFYHAGNKVLRSQNQGMSWEEISPDLSRNETGKQGPGGRPFTNEAAGGENYNTISYLACSPLQEGLIWAGTDDGLIHRTLDEGKTWTNLTPPGIGEALINCIEISPMDPATVYIAATRYKFNDFQPMIYRTRDQGQSWEKISRGIHPEAYTRVVRADPKQAGLLYAGTEAGLYVSFDDGRDWKRWQSSLPLCPITDLTIRDNDLIVATSGRGFWILDDLGCLQQSNGQWEGPALQLFTPKASYKFNINTPSRPPKGQGENPASGIIFDYYIPKGKDTLEITLEVLDERGNTIRTYTNQPEKGYTSYEGGPPPKQVLPTKAGLNRFHWDLRHDPLPPVPGVFVMGDYRGHLSAPGNYRLRLSLENDTVQVACTLIPDPRLEAGEKDFQAQQTLLITIEKTVLDIHASVNQMRSVRKQVEHKLELLKEIEGTEMLRDTGKFLLKRIHNWEEQLIQPKQKTFQDVINFPNQLNAELLNLKARIDQHDPRPTQGARQRLDDLLEIWSTQKAVLMELIEMDIGAFNKIYRELEIPALIVPD